MASDSDYEIYEGRLGDFTSHRSIVCSTGGATTATIAPDSGDRYYLVVPTTGLSEGSYGQDGAGNERPAAIVGFACLAEQFAQTCP